MRSIVMLSLILTLGSPCAVEAQPLPGGPASPAAPNRSPAGNGRQGAASATLLANPDTPPPAESGFAPPGQKPPRPDNAVGPDLVAYVFAPVGKIVGPITDGLHVFDRALAPINALVLPLTGPLARAPEAPPVAEAVPTGRGPRK